MKVKLTEKAKLHARNERKWWRKNRDAKELFTHELRAARKELSYAPQLQIHEEIDGRVIRELQLPKTHHTVYFWINESAETVWVMAIWGQCRGQEPEFGRPI